jgi:hypothetical protein
VFGCEDSSVDLGVSKVGCNERANVFVCKSTCWYLVGGDDRRLITKGEVSGTTGGATVEGPRCALFHVDDFVLLGGVFVTTLTSGILCR